MSSETSRLRVLLALAVALAVGGCGAAGHDAPVPPASAHAAIAPALLRRAPETGEILLHGEASPATHGPYALHGRYLIRFAQYAPEDPRMDFAQQTTFVVLLRPVAGGVRARARPLFRAAAATGRRTLALDGRYRVEVSFGDFPYVVRFTPAAAVR